MKSSSLLAIATALSCVAAQSTTDPLDQFISDAFSVYTQITSVLASAASVASVAATASSSATTLSSVTRSSSTSSEAESSHSSSAETSEQTSSRSSSSSLQSSAASSTSTDSSQSSLVSSSSASISSLDSSRTSGPVGTSSILGAAAETGTSDPSTAAPKNNNGDHKLAVILGTVLGALALGLLLLALLICCRRKRSRSSSPRHRALSPGDDEVDSWRVSHLPGMITNRNTSSRDSGVPGAAPLMSEHPAFRGETQHENPFVPVPPPPRRTAPNSRAGLTDGMIPGENPFLEKEIGGDSRPTTSRSRDSSHKRTALAAGLAGAAIGAGLMHHQKRQDDEKTLVTDEPSYDPVDEPQSESQPAPQSKISRKPVPVNNVNNSESWPYSPVSPIDPAAEMAAIAKNPTSSSSQESRRSFSRDAARANATFDQQYSPPADDLDRVSDTPSGHGQALATAAAGLAAAGIGGAAIAHHRDKRRSRSSSTSSRHRHSQGYSHSQSPQRPAIPGQPEGSNLSSSSNESSNNYTYSDALATQSDFTPIPATNPVSHPSPTQPQAYTRPDPYDIPPAPPTRSRRNSALGTAAPAAAAFSYINRPAVPSPLSSEIRHDQGFSPPRYPSRSPRRSSRGRSSQDSTPYDDVYTSNPWVSHHSNNNAHDDDYTDYTETSNLHQQDASGATKAIVGDNGYPHMGIPRRKSGGEYDFNATGPFGPQMVVPPPPAPAGTRSSTMNSDDSTWRLSSGMPGGWRRGSGEYGNRASGEFSRRPQQQGRLRASDVVDGAGDGRYYQGVGQAL